MKHTKRLLAVLLTLVLLCTSVPFAFAEDDIWHTDGIVSDEQVVIRFVLNGAYLKDSQWVYSFATNAFEFKTADEIGTEEYDMVPQDENSQLPGDSIMLPGIKPPIGYRFVGWACETNNWIYAVSEYRIPAGQKVITFRATFELGSIKSLEGETVKVGENLYYSLDNRILTVSGYGKIYDGLSFFDTDWERDEDKSFEKIVIEQDVTEVFPETFSLETKAFVIAPENAVYSSDEYGVLFNKDKSLLIRYPTANPRREYNIPATVQTLDQGAFLNCFNLEQITFPEDLQEIGTFSIFHTAVSELVLPKTLKRIDAAGLANNYWLDGVLEIRSMEVELEEYAIGNEALFYNVPKNLIFPLLEARLSDYDALPDSLKAYFDPVSREIYPEFFELATDDLLFAGTIRCHAGSTAEAYAIEHGMDYELTHFFEGDWNYDWENLVRWRKCIHCDERETEPLETETPGGAEIVGPADGDTSFDVEPVSTDYVLIKEALGEQNVVKAFDISLKNNDGVHVQPKGTVKVKLPGDFKTGDYKVYRVNADGTYTDMQAFREGSHLVFYTDHFSLYVVVDESAGTEPDTPDTPDTPDAPVKESKVKNILHIIFAFLQKLIRLLIQK